MCVHQISVSPSVFKANIIIPFHVCTAAVTQIILLLSGMDIYKIVDTSEWFKRHQNSVLNLTLCSLIYTTRIFPCESLRVLKLWSKLKTKYVSDNAWIAFEMFVQDDNWS